MALIELPHSIQNPNLSSAAELNENYDKISDEVNGNIDEENISNEADLVINTLTTSTIYSVGFEGDTTIVIKLPSNDGTHSVKFNDYLGNAIIEIKSNGEVII